MMQEAKISNEQLHELQKIRENAFTNEIRMTHTYRRLFLNFSKTETDAEKKLIEALKIFESYAVAGGPLVDAHKGLNKVMACIEAVDWN